jgi:AraC-like DNA-binding protein
MHVEQIPISWAVRQAAPAMANGISLDMLFERAFITPKFGDDRDRITPLQLALFQAVLVHETDDGSHSMMRERMDPEIGPLGFRILLRSANLADGLVALSKFYKNSTRSIRFELSVEGRQAFFAVQAANDLDEGPVQEDIQLVYLYLGLTCFLGRPFPVSWVTTRDHQHFNLHGEHHTIRSPVRMGPCAGLAFPKALLASPPSRPDLEDFLWRPIYTALRLMEEPSKDARHDTTNENFRVDKMAADLMIAPSTFRRKLAQEGCSFRQLRERALVDATLALLRVRSCSLEAIAAELGYADARSLRRFVKRATGRTPDNLRNELNSAVSPAKLHARLKETLFLLPH